MRTAPPDLLPIFRTNLQAELLAALFLGDAEATPAGELVERTSAPAASVYRELARLVDAGLIERERERRGAGFRPAKSSPLYEPMRELLERTMGVEPDSAAAAELIAQARAHLESARIDGVDAQSAYGMAYQAALKAMVAALLADGTRVTTGADGHIVIVQQAEAHLDLDPAVSSRIDHMRRTRHRVFYDGDEVSELELGGALADADAVVAAAAEAVDRA